MIKTINSLFAVAALFLVIGVATQSEALAGGCGGKVVSCKSIGPAINGMVPEQQAWFDETNLLCGGDTIFSAQVKNVNLMDGTELALTIDGYPLGSITLKNHEASVSNVDVGRTNFSHDQYIVSANGVEIMECNNFTF